MAQKRNGAVINVSLSEVEMELLDWLVPQMPSGHQSRSGVIQGMLLRLAWEKSAQGQPLPPKFAEMVGESKPKKK